MADAEAAHEAAPPPPEAAAKPAAKAGGAVSKENEKPAGQGNPAGASAAPGGGGGGEEGGKESKTVEANREKDEQKDIMTMVVGHARRAAKSSIEATAIFVGSQGAGKSTLMQRYTAPDREEDPKPTPALDYSFTRKEVKREGAGAAGGGKEVCHMWEIGGGSALANLLDVPLTESTVKNVTVCVVVDMSRPAEMFPCLAFWMERVRARLREVETQLRAKPATAKVMDQLRERAKKRFSDKHPDMVGEFQRKMMSLTGINLLIVAHKADALADRDPDMKKVMGRTLRFVAHTNGAGLVYTSTRDKQSMVNLKKMLNQQLFREAPVKTKVVDHNKYLYLMVPSGADTLKDIGQPPVQPSEKDTPLDLWRKAFQGYFGTSPPLTMGVAALPEVDPKKQFSEKAVDEARAHKEHALWLYKESAARAASEAAKATSKARPAGGAKAPSSSRPPGDKAASSSSSSSRPSGDRDKKRSTAPPPAEAAGA
uniref:Cytoplasmic dynein 2 light intermediate chain 1 n=1 Tax=Hemiselmis tepida TaxID=464990 RepID=A0A7S0VVP7_9CRYP